MDVAGNGALMPNGLVAVADGPGSTFATLSVDGVVSLWSGLGERLAQFDADVGQASIPVPSSRLAIATDGDNEPSIVVGSWTQGVAAFRVEGEMRWHRRDIRHVQRLRVVPGIDHRTRVLTATREQGGGLLLGQDGRTTYHIPGAKFLDGWPDASLLVFDGQTLSRRPGPYSHSSWSLNLATFAVLDAVVDSDALVCGADGTLTRINSDGEVIWRAATGEGERVVRVRSHPDSGGWVCLAVSNRRGGSPRVLRFTRDGVVAAAADLPGDWIDFVSGSRLIVATNGTISEVPDLS